MSSTPTQERRIAELTTSLGKDKLLLTRLAVSEGLSELFEIRVDCLSEGTEQVDLGQIIGKDASVRFNSVSSAMRHFAGVVVEATWLGGEHREKQMQAYQVIMRPWTWLLSQAAGSRIFQNKSVVEIIKHVFDDAGFAGKYEDKLSEQYKPLEYCVQYRESHLDFVLRLMEQFGIYYFFKHEAGKHTMVLADSSSAHETIESLATVKFTDAAQRTKEDQDEFLREWASERRFRTGKVTVKAFDFDKPNTRLMHDKESPGGYANDRMEVYLYPKKYKVDDLNDLDQKYVNAALESLQTQDKRRYAAGGAPSLFPGGLTTLEKHKAEGENKEYLVVSAQHSFTAEQYKAGGRAEASGLNEPYQGRYVLQLKDQPFRAPQVTPRPVIYGPQTAFVVGPSSEEIYTDKHGRVKLQFHWDRDGKSDENSSRWVRVSQMWSGKQWGGFYIPRIGMEAVVEFIDGDPDRPLVVGTVYNGENMMPAEMPTNKTQHGMKTRSSKGGKADTYNELVFEDLKDAEFIRFHAEKDLDGTIEDTEKRVIKGKNVSAGTPARTTTIEQGDDVLELKSGHQKVTVSETITVKAGQKIVLDVGNGCSTITMTPSGIKIETVGTIDVKANLMNVNGGTKLDQKAGVIQLNC